MPLALYFSNSVERLAQCLSEQIRTRLSRQDPLSPVEIIVPNVNLAKWLQLELARRQGIAMNLAFQYLETGLWEMLAALDDSPNGVEPLNRHNLTLRLMAVLEAADLNRPELAPLGPYLEATRTIDRDLRLWQLSRRLAWLFREYEYHRSEMVARWRQPGTEEHPLAQCQRHLYRTVGAAPSTVGDTADMGMSLHAYADKVLNRSTPRPPEGPPPTVHCFGLSQLSAFHADLLHGLRQWYEIQIYTLNPCEAYWEDIHPRTRRRKSQKGPTGDVPSDNAGLQGPQGHPLLAAWGKAGRDHIGMLCQLTDYDFESLYDAPKSDSVLHRLQRDLLTLGPAGAESAPSRRAQDRSLQIVGAPGRRRAVAWAYQSILGNLRSDPDLKPTDVAVLVTRMAPYLPHLELTFGRAPLPFAHNIVDSQADTQSAYGRAVLGLLTLAQSAFSRQAVFDLIQNPCVMQRFGIDAQQLAVFARWIEALGIYHGFERAPAAPDEPPGGSFSWLQGLRRLRLARIFAPAGQGRDHFANLAPYSDIHTADEPLLQRFCQVVEMLHAASRALDTTAKAARWQTALTQWCDRLLAIPLQLTGENNVRQAIREALAEMVRAHELAPKQAPPPYSPVMVKAYLGDRLAAMTGGRGEYLTDGVTIAQLQPMRPIPFKIIYVLGLEDGAFPGRPEPATLDLRRTHPGYRRGETTLPERNRYLFLETLLSVRRKLYLGYISRDLEKDRYLQPSNPVMVLKRHLETAILPAGHRFNVRQIPLSEHDRRCFDNATAAHWSDTGPPPDLARHVAYYRREGLWETVTQRLRAKERDRLAPLTPKWDIAPTQTEAVTSRTERIYLGGLCYFLQDPLNATARRLLGRSDLWDPRELFETETDEPFVTAQRHFWELRRQTLHEWIVSRITKPDHTPWQVRLDNCFASVYAGLQRRGAMPAGSFAKSDAHLQRDLIAAVAGQAAAVVEKMAGAHRLYRQAVIGRPAAAVPDDTFWTYLRHRTIGMPPPAGDDDARIEIDAQWDWLWQDSDGGWHTLAPVFVNGSGGRVAATLRPAMLWVLLRAAGALEQGAADAGLAIHLPGPTAINTVDFNVSPGRAKAYLSTLLGHYFDARQMPWLPLKEVLKPTYKLARFFKRPPTDPERRAFTNALEAAREKIDDPLFHLVEPTAMETALDQALIRLKPFRSLWE